MGIYTDYGRFVKARQFKNWCNSGAGIWFGFGLGSPVWDKIITDSNNNGRPNVPPSSPNSYSPVYRWYKTQREAETGDDDYILQPQELALIDRSYWGDTQGTYPDDETIKNNPTLPPRSNCPSLSIYDSESGEVKSDKFEGIETSDYYSSFSNSTPYFPMSYKSDWETLVQNYDPSFDPTDEPTDPTKYLEFAYNYHLYYSRSSILDEYGSQVTYGAPLGFLSFIQGKAYFVAPVQGSESNVQDSLKTFKYGNHYWRIIPDTELSTYDPGDPRNLPHHILLTVTVFPNELALSSLVERELPVRQVSVFKFPDYLVSELELDQSPLPRSAQVIRRDNINFRFYSIDLEGFSTSLPSPIKNIKFSTYNPLDPNDLGVAEILINDYMTARTKDVQQTDRYGYIIGF